MLCLNRTVDGAATRLTGSVAFFEVVGVAPGFEDVPADFNSVRPTTYVPESQPALFLRRAHPDTPPYEMQLISLGSRRLRRR